jgi:hypothetical protein
MNHHTNLVVQILFKLSIVDKFEDVLQSLYANFSHNPKRIQEFVELVDIMEIRVGENLKNIKTHYISKFFPIKRVLFKYYALVLKMHQDVDIINQVAHNLELFCDLELMLGFFCMSLCLKG